MKKINYEIEILEFLYQEVLMEKDTYSFIIKKDKEDKQRRLDSIFINKVGNAIIEYNKFLNSIRKMLENRNKKIEDADLFFRVATYFSIDIKNSTKEEISNHLKHGTEVIKNKILQKDYLDVSKTIKNLIKRLVEYQESLINTMQIT